mgnify:FL=1
MRRTLSTHHVTIATPSTSKVNVFQSESESDDSDSDKDSAHEVLSSTRRDELSSEPKTKVPVSKWGVKFTGEAKSISVVAFLERVEELRIARGLSTEELVRSAVDLFEGRALNWFRTIRERVHRWTDLENLLRAHYLPPDYKHRLFHEILSRTQGQNENCIDYLTAMTTMFKRHGSIDADVKLGILTRNLAPFYLSQLPVVSNLEELERECLRIEVIKHRVDHYQPPSRRRTDQVEPELASIAEVETPSATETRNRQSRGGSSANVVCYNCKVRGHISGNCTAPLQRRCYRCSEPNVTVRTCPRCNPPGTSGNGNRNP